jgi:hypothetical protein
MPEFHACVAGHEKSTPSGLRQFQQFTILLLVPVAVIIESTWCPWQVLADLMRRKTPRLAPAYQSVKSASTATVSEIVLGFAPGYVACTATVGGTTSGYSLMGNRHIAINPDEEDDRKHARENRTADEENVRIPSPFGRFASLEDFAGIRIETIVKRFNSAAVREAFLIRKLKLNRNCLIAPGLSLVRQRVELPAARFQLHPRKDRSDPRTRASSTEQGRKHTCCDSQNTETKDRFP